MELDEIGYREACRDDLITLAKIFTYHELSVKVMVVTGILLPLSWLGITAQFSFFWLIIFVGSVLVYFCTKKSAEKFIVVSGRIVQEMRVEREKAI